MKFEIFKEKNSGNSLIALSAGDWRWRLLAANGQIIATSGEGYINKADCLHGISLVKSAQTATADIVDVTQASSTLLTSMLGVKL